MRSINSPSLGSPLYTSCILATGRGGVTVGSASAECTPVLRRASASRLGSLVACLVVPRPHRVPVHRVPPGVEVVRAPVLVVEVVGVLPDVDSEDRRVTFHERGVLVRRRVRLEP